MNRLAIRTPEGILFTLPLAGPVSRLLAWSVDQACILAAMTVLGRALSVAGALGQVVMVIAYFALSIGYAMACEWYWRGQTLGKRLLGLRVMDEQGLRLEFSQVAVRNLLRFVDYLPALYLVGGAACVLTARSQRLGDLAANTIVARTDSRAQPDLAQLLAGSYNSLLEYPHLTARLRHRASPRAAAVALDALLRRNEFRPEARLDLFAELAVYFRGLVEFPPEATEQLSDEQYVRDAVEILYGRGRQAALRAP
ncbi:MAG: RDD family protein [Acidobacteriota bacterium]|nr:RDD family protein [Acidobacteriota bacterium]